MRLIRFVAVACMVAVSVASLGCGETAPVTKADTPAETSSTEMSSTEKSEAATEGTTPVSLAISGMA